MDQLSPDLPNTVTRNRPVNHEPTKSTLLSREIFEGLSLLLTIEEILQLHRDLRHKSEEEVRSLAEQCHRSCESSAASVPHTLNVLSCCSCGFPTVVTIFPNDAVFTYVLGLQHVHSISRIDVPGTLLEHYVYGVFHLAAAIRRRGA